MDCSGNCGTVVSTLVGGLLTIGVAWFYFWKSKPVEKRLASIADNLRHLFVQERFPEFFTSEFANRVSFDGSRPSNTDVPHLDYAIFDHKTVHPEEEVKLLLKVIDLGFNFRNPNGAKLTDEFGATLALNNVGFGCMKTTFKAPTAVGEKRLTLVLNDEGKDGRPLHTSPKYEIKYSVVPRAAGEGK